MRVSLGDSAPLFRKRRHKLIKYPLSLCTSMRAEGCKSLQFFLSSFCSRTLTVVFLLFVWKSLSDLVLLGDFASLLLDVTQKSWDTQKRLHLRNDEGPPPAHDSLGNFHRVTIVALHSLTKNQCNSQGPTAVNQQSVKTQQWQQLHISSVSRISRHHHQPRWFLLLLLPVKITVAAPHHHGRHHSLACSIHIIIIIKIARLLFLHSRVCLLTTAASAVAVV